MSSPIHLAPYDDDSHLKCAKTEDEDEGRTCRICFDDESEGRLISPCRCKGSMRFVHVHCLAKWRAEARNRSYYECGQCKYQYSLRRVTAHSMISHPVVIPLLTTLAFLALWAFASVTAVGVFGPNTLRSFFVPPDQPDASKPALVPSALVIGLSVLGVLGFVAGLLLDFRGTCGSFACNPFGRGIGNCPFLCDSCVMMEGEGMVLLSCALIAIAVVLLGTLNTFRFIGLTLKRAVTTTVDGLDTYVLDISESGPAAHGNVGEFSGVQVV